MKVLVTGAAGFIGMHVARRLLENGQEVIGVDNLNDYYSTALKSDRLDQLFAYPGFHFHKLDLADQPDVDALFAQAGFSHVVHLAAQAGVRYSLENPHAYIASNIQGFVNVLEACKHARVAHLLYASSSSVYGANTKMPFSEQDNADHPVSLYAATKKANELFAHSYSHLYNLPTTGLRFFTVYGPWGRPDMSPMIFANAIIRGQPIKVFNEGRMKRDFTYIDDVVEGVIRLLEQPAQPAAAFDRNCPNPATSYAPYRIYNIGNHQPVDLMAFIHTLEEAIGQKADIQLFPMQPGDVTDTYADIADLHAAVQFFPQTPLALGMQHFVEWYQTYYSPAQSAVARI